MGGGTTITGRRLADSPQGKFPLQYNNLRPGDIWKLISEESGEPLKSKEPGNLTGCVWMFMAPDKAGLGILTKHTVREHEDGTVSVRPGDGSSNSIKIDNGRGRTWHGYVCHNDWTSVD